MASAVLVGCTVGAIVCLFAAIGRALQGPPS